TRDVRVVKAPLVIERSGPRSRDSERYVAADSHRAALWLSEDVWPYRVGRDQSERSLDLQPSRIAQIQTGANHKINHVARAQHQLVGVTRARVGRHLLSELLHSVFEH